MGEGAASGFCGKGKEIQIASCPHCYRCSGKMAATTTRTTLATASAQGRSGYTSRPPSSCATRRTRQGRWAAPEENLWKKCGRSVNNLGCVFPPLWAALIIIWALCPSVLIPAHLNTRPPSSSPQAAPSLWASRLAGPWGRLLGHPARLHTLEVATGSGSRGLLVSG